MGSSKSCKTLGARVKLLTGGRDKQLKNSCVQSETVDKWDQYRHFKHMAQRWHDRPWDDTQLKVLTSWVDQATKEHVYTK